LLPREAAADEQQKLRTYNGDTDPYPIPWLDKNSQQLQHVSRVHAWESSLTFS
jgi:hypothetical protein